MTTDTTNALRAHPAIRDLIEQTEHCVSCADEGVDYGCSREWLEAMTTLRLMEKVGRGRWAPTDAGRALAALATAQPEAKPEGNELIELANRIRSHAKWEPCDCGCESERPADKASVAYIRAASLVRDFAARTRQAQGTEAKPEGVESIDADALGRFAHDEWMDSFAGYPAWGLLDEKTQQAWLAVGARIKRVLVLTFATRQAQGGGEDGR